MPLLSGTRLGSYEITGTLGAGGMGEVYRATDTTLGRQVAIKVLPDAFAQDADRIARFGREAKTLASLNHPNIAHIYGLEQTDGIKALVMELVEGPTLAQRIAEGPIPIDEALPIAKQIADALEAAHEQGIIHRDLKPANVKVRPDGTVKVLDFGLAKAMEPAVNSLSSASMSPTITTPAMTQAGMILGTAAYTSPEQARGKTVDRRSDIWAFGCVLYEMLTGSRAFHGEDVTDTLAAVLRDEPDWSVLPAATPAATRKLLHRSLEKDPKARLDSAATARLEITDSLARERDVGIPGATATHVWRRVAALAVGGALAGAAVVGGVVWFALRPTPPPMVRLTMSTPDANALVDDHNFSITPDGSRVVYRSRSQILVRALDQQEPTHLDVANATSLFLSPDGQWVGFFAGGALKKIPISGGAPVTLSPGDGTSSRGATWGADGTVVFATFSGVTGLQRVSSDGGDVTVLTTATQETPGVDHVWPEFLPGGRAVLFTIIDSLGSPSQLAVLDLQTGTQRVLVPGASDGKYVPTGHLLFRVGGALHAVPFDVDRLEVTGTSIPVLEDVGVSGVGVVAAVVSASGTLVYLPGSATGGERRRLVWVDRQGREEFIGVSLRPYLYPRLSPDSTRVALTSNDEQQDLWVWDLRRETLTRLTFDPATDLPPVWAPDNRQLAFSSTRAGGQFNLFMQAVDGTGSVTRLTESLNQQNPTGITPDGMHMLFNEVVPGQRRNLRMLTLVPAPRVESLLATRFEERGAVVSPDGRWLAYESDNSGRFEIYVRPFPAVDEGQWQLSTAGGVQPLWSRDGRELFYVAPNGALMTVPTEPTASLWSAGAPTPVVRPGYFTAAGLPFTGRHYDVTLDGQRFLMLKEDESAASTAQISVVLNWFEELKRLVPTN